MGVGGVSPPKGVGGGLRGLLQENFSFENALRVSFRLSGVHIWTYETRGSYLYSTTTIDHLTFNESVLKTSCERKSALIRSPKLEKQKKPADSRWSVEREELIVRPEREYWGKKCK